MTKEHNLEMLDMIGRDTPGDEIESLRAQLAAANAEVQEQARLNGMGSEREAKLLAQLAEVTKERDAARSEAQCRSWEIVEKQSQLLATQANAARMVEAIDFAIDCWECELLLTDAVVIKAKSALSTPINLDALHEHDARVLEDVAKNINKELGAAPTENVIAGSDEVRSTILAMAAAHRSRCSTANTVAKKEGK